MSYPLTQSIASVLRKVRWVKCLVHHIEKFFGLIILDLCINVHSCFAIFMSGKILNRLGINACIEQICDVGVPELMGCHFKIKGVDDPWVVFLTGSQGRLLAVRVTIYCHSRLNCV